MNITPLGYLTQNSFIRYPFRDGMSLVSTQTFKLTNAMFLDLQIVTSDQSIREAFLSELSYSTHLTIRFTLLNASRVKVKDISVTVAESNVLDKKLITYTDTSNDTIKIVLGNFPSTLLSAPFAHTFLHTATRVQNSCLITFRPQIKNLELYNQNNTSVKKVSGNQSLTLAKGANVGFRSDKGLAIRVVPGAGQGLYNPCDTLPTNILRRVNDLLPTSNGNFTIHTGDCIGSTRRAYGLSFRHLCKPRCSETHVNAYAYYLNRVKDGLLTVNTYATALKQTLDAMVADYKAQQKKRITKKVPYILADKVVTNASGFNYVSIAVGIFNPRKEDMLATLYVKHLNDINIAYVPNTSRFTADGVTQDLIGDPGFIDRVIPCKSSAVYEYVLKIPADKRNVVVAMTLKHPRGSAYHDLIIAPDKPYFSARYTNFKSDVTFNEAMVFDMFDPLNAAVETSLFVTLPAKIVFVSSSGKLNLNNTVTNYNATRFISIMVNFKHKATYSFQAETKVADVVTIVDADKIVNIEAMLVTVRKQYIRSIPMKFVL